MFVVALLAQKGGVGKTTLSYTIAVQAELAGLSVLLVDADPQASAYAWNLDRGKKSGKEPLQIAAVRSPAELKLAVQTAQKDGFEMVVIDTPPGVSEVPATAAMLADMVIIPCVPSVRVMDALAPTVKLVKLAKKPGFFVVNLGSHRSKAINDDCLLAMSSSFGLPATNCHVPQRQPVVDAEALGLTIAELPGKSPSVERGRTEVQALWSWLNKQREELAHV